MIAFKRTHRVVALVASTVVLTVAFNNCGGPSTKPLAGTNSSSSVAGTSSPSPSPSVGQASCDFDGWIIGHGQFITAYATRSVPAGSSCVPESRTCNNGVLSGSHAFSGCVVEATAAPLSCSFGDSTVNSGSSVTAYQASSVPYGSTCVSQTRTCNNGALSGSYQAASCTVQEAPSTPSPSPSPSPAPATPSAKRCNLNSADQYWACEYPQTSNGFTNWSYGLTRQQCIDFCSSQVAAVNDPGWCSYLQTQCHYFTLNSCPSGPLMQSGFYVTDAASGGCTVQ